MRTCAILLICVMIALVFTCRPASTRGEELGSSPGSSSRWPAWSEWKIPRPGIPKLSTPKEPEFLKSTRRGITRAWNGTKRSTINAWNATKETLRPYDSPDEQRNKSSKSSGNTEGDGFWAKLFGGNDKPKRTETVNDFLRQPMIY